MGMEIQIHTYAKNAHSTQTTAADADPFRSLHLGLFLLNTTDTVESTDRLNSWDHDTIKAYVTDGAPEDDAEPRVLFQNGLAMVMDSARQHCSFDGQDCWTVRVHPKISEISQSEGYLTGGQELTIKGWGFNGTEVSVEIDGIACEVVTAEREQITCITGATDFESATGYQPGQQGLTQV